MYIQKVKVFPVLQVSTLWKVNTTYHSYFYGALQIYAYCEQFIQALNELMLVSKCSHPDSNYLLA